MDAHYQLADLYRNGQGVESDLGKTIKEAAIGGHPFARFNLGCRAYMNENHERAVKHFIMPTSYRIHRL